MYDIDRELFRMVVHGRVRDMVYSGHCDVCRDRAYRCVFGCDSNSKSGSPCVDISLDTAANVAGRGHNPSPHNGAHGRVHACGTKDRCDLHNGIIVYFSRMYGPSVRWSYRQFPSIYHCGNCSVRARSASGCVGRENGASLIFVPSAGNVHLPASCRKAVSELVWPGRERGTGASIVAASREIRFAAARFVGESLVAGWHRRRS